jgi:hypothetical protein
MMIGHNEESNLGTKCFGITYTLSQEFYYKAMSGKDSLGLTSGTPLDGFGNPTVDAALVAAHAKANDDWNRVEKNEEGRVTHAAFKHYFMTKHGMPSQFSLDPVDPSSWVQAALTAHADAAEAITSFDPFLDLTFTSALRMMLPSQKFSVGQHCFKYASLMAHEFYFPGPGPEDVLELKTGSNPLATETHNAYQALENGARVTLGDLISFIESLDTDDWLQELSYGAYLAALFDAGTAMMIPKGVDLGVHCFGMTYVLSQEFYYNEQAGADFLGLLKDEPDKYADPVLKAAHANAQADWEAVAKDEDGRVTRDAFREHFMNWAVANAKFAE